MYANNILPTSGPKEVDPVTIANIQRQSQEREYEIVEDCIGNVKLKNYTSEDSALSRQPGLFQYYCSLCGCHSLVTTSSLASVFRRRTDLALILDPNIEFVKYFIKGKKVALKRTNGIELQWRWNCKDCNIELGYQSCPYETRFSNDLDNKGIEKTKDCLYIFPNSLATEACYCELIETVNKSKNNEVE